MHGPSHLFLSWYVAEAAGLRTSRDRRIVAWSGFAPDLEVIGYVAAIIYFGFDKDLAFQYFWQPYHHQYTHGIGFVLLTGCIAYVLSKKQVSASQIVQPVKVSLLSMFVSVLHNFGDLIAGGPGWPIYPLWPFNEAAWSVSWSWTLAQWPNTLVLFVCMAGIFLYAKIAGYSPVEVFNYRLERWFVCIVKHGSDQHMASKGSNTVRGVLRKRIIIYVLLILIILAVLLPLGFQTEQFNLAELSFD